MDTGFSHVLALHSSNAICCKLAIRDCKAIICHAKGRQVMPEADRRYFIDLESGVLKLK